jgi:aerobic carbon-monoxide dehydrogenase large subunit
MATTLADYLLVTASDMPELVLGHRETPTTLNPLGVKGIGESGTVPAAGAMISGIEDALSSYGVRIDEAPISPAKLFQLIRASNTEGTSAPDVPRKELAAG